jgi:hypothetical protein
VGRPAPFSSARTFAARDGEVAEAEGFEPS